MDGFGGTLADEFMNDFEEDDFKEPVDDDGNLFAFLCEKSFSSRLFEANLEAVQETADRLDGHLPPFPRLMREEAQFREVTEAMHSENADAISNYQLIVAANELAVDVAEHQGVVAKYVKDVYAERFPELEGLVPDKMEYLRTVNAIRNNVEDMASIDLDAVLPGHTSMIVRIGATTTSGRPLSQERLNLVLRACDEAQALEISRRQILAFIESQMSRVAPNLSTLVGTRVAAMLMTAAGGLEPLSKLPANTVRVLGTQKKNLQGMSTSTQIKHVGFLEQCDLISSSPQSIRTQAIRVLAGRVALSARVDAQSGRKSQTVTVGNQYREEMESKIAKWLAPPPPRQIKALPVPKTGEGKTERRGGDQARRMKAKTKMTELRKQQNRLAFGEIKEEGLHDIMGGDLGMIGTNMGTGKIKIAVEDTGILKGLSKKRKLEIAKAMEPGQGSRTSFGRASHLQIQSGMKSSLALEGDRGIELVEKTTAVKNDQKAAAPVKNYFGGGGFKAPAPKQ